MLSALGHFQLWLCLIVPTISCGVGMMFSYSGMCRCYYYYYFKYNYCDWTVNNNSRSFLITYIRRYTVYIFTHDSYRNALLAKELIYIHSVSNCSPTSVFVSVLLWHRLDDKWQLYLHSHLAQIIRNQTYFFNELSCHCFHKTQCA